MKVDDMIKFMDRYFGDELECLNKIREFLKAYQERVKELEEAICKANEARDLVADDNIWEYIQQRKIEIGILTGFYEEGENPFETV